MTEPCGQATHIAEGGHSPGHTSFHIGEGLARGRSDLLIHREDLDRGTSSLEPTHERTVFGEDHMHVCSQHKRRNESEQGELAS